MGLAGDIHSAIIYGVPTEPALLGSVLSVTQNQGELSNSQEEFWKKQPLR